MNKTKFKELKKLVIISRKNQLLCLGTSITEYILFVIGWYIFVNGWVAIILGIVTLELMLQLGFSLEILMFVYLHSNNEEVRT